MFTRTGINLLGISLAVILMTQGSLSVDARGFRNRASNKNYSTKMVKPQTAAPKQHTTAKPAIPDPGKETAKMLTPSASASKSSSRNTAELSFQKGFTEYDLLGTNFSQLIRIMPEREGSLLKELTENHKPDYAENIAKKYPQVRPEVQETLARVAEAVHQGKSKPEIGKIVQEMPIPVRQLKSNEVLAVNQELAPAIDPEEARAVLALNQFRMRSGLRPCLIDLLLCLVSRGHSSDMRNYGFFSHNSPVAGKGHFTSRARQMGASASAENIYMGSSSGNAANSAWANSSGHRANMLGGFSRVGVGRAGGYFTQMFGH